MPVQRYMYLLYLHPVHNIMYLQSFAACVVPVFIAYMLPARSFKKKKQNRPPEQYYSICTVHYFGSLLLLYRGGGRALVAQ